MARKKREVIKKVAVKKAPVKEVIAPVEEIKEIPVVEEVKVVKPDGIWDEGHALIGKRWEMTNETITAIVSETDTVWTVLVSDGCTYHLAK